MRRALAIACALSSLPAHAAARWSLTGPPTVAGDGKTVARFTLAIEPAAGEQQLEASADGGSVALRADGPGRFTVELTPPRVAVELVVTVAVAFVGGDGRAETKVRVVPPPADAEEARSGGPLDLRAPSRLLLGSDGEAFVSVARVAGPPPRLACSVGKLSPPVVAGGRWRARYTPPVERMPQLAIVAALDEKGAPLDWIAVRLDGRPRVDTRTKPNARVSVRVAGVEFGPVQADQKGQVTMAVIAPPGVTDGVAVAIDRLGNATEAPLPLGAPLPKRLWALCAMQQLSVVAVGLDGRPWRGAPLAARSSAGALDPLVERAPGVYVAPFHPPSSGGSVELSAASEGDPASRAACAVTIPVEPVAAGAGDRAIDSSLAVRRERERPPIGLAVRLGYLTNFFRVSAPFAAVEASVRLPPWRRALSLGLLAGWWGGQAGGLSADGSERVDAFVSTVPLLARASLQLPVPRVGLYLGATGGALIVHTDARSPSAGASAATEVVAAGGGFVAADLRVGPGRLGVEVGYLYGALQGPTVSGNVAGLAATVGYRLELGR